MAYEYKFFPEDDKLKYVKLHGTTSIRVSGMMRRRDGGAWEDIALIDLELEPHDATRLQFDIFRALREFFTNNYTSLTEAYGWLDNTTWSAEELTIPEPE